MPFLFGFNVDVKGESATLIFNICLKHFFKLIKDKKKYTMKNLNKLKILIVGLTSVLALSNFNNKDLRKGIVRLHDSAVSAAAFKNDLIQINN